MYVTTGNSVEASRQRRGWRVEPAVALVAIALIGVVGYDVVRSWGGELLDVNVYRQGAQQWLTGQDVYATSGLDINLPFLYPPLAAVLFSSLAVVSAETAGVVMTVLSFAALVLAAVVLARRLPERTGPWPLVAAGMVALCLQFEPVRHTFGFGQINLLLLALVVVDCLVDLRWLPRGVLVGLAAAIKLTPLVFLVYFLLRRDTRAVVATVSSFVGCMALGFLLAPQASISYWTDVVFDSAERVGNEYAGNQSIYGVLSRAGFDEGGLIVLWLLVAIAVTAIGAVAMRRALRLGSELTAVAICGVVGVMVSPISWSHHWVWVLPALAATLEIMSWRVLLPAVVVAAIFVLAPHWLVPNNDGLEYGWTAGEWLLGNAYLLTAAVVLVIVAVAGFRRRVAESHPRGIMSADADIGG